MSERFDDFHHFLSTPHEDMPDWMNAYFTDIGKALIRANLTTLVAPVHVEPPRLYDGLMAYADGTDWDPGSGRGIYYWTSLPDPGEWISMDATNLERDAIDNFVGAAYGGVVQNVAVSLPDIDLTPQIAPTNAGSVVPPLLVTEDVANDGIIFLVEGIYCVSITLTIEHDSRNFGRIYHYQIYDSTDAVVLLETTIGTGRNQEATNYSVTVLTQIDATLVDHLIVGRLVTDGDVYTDVLLDGYTLSTWSVGRTTAANFAALAES